MDYYFLKASFDLEIFISISPIEKDGSCLDPYNANGEPNPKYGVYPENLYCFLESKNALKGNGSSLREFIRLDNNLYMVSERVFKIIEQLNINFKKINIELIDLVGNGIKEVYYGLNLFDILSSSLEISKSEIKYGNDGDRKYISRVDKFVFSSKIDVDLFIPRDSIYFYYPVCSEVLKKEFEINSVLDVKIESVNDFIAIHEERLGSPEALEIIPRPRSADYYLERRLKKKGKK